MPGFLGDKRLNFCLRFSPDIEAQYEYETRPARIKHVRISIVVGLLLYNIYGICCYYLLTDIYGLAIALRSLVMSPPWIAYLFLLPKLPAFWREIIPFMGMNLVVALSVSMFLLSTDQNAPYFLVEILLALCCANMLLQQRFRYALWLTVVSLSLLVSGVMTKDGMEFGLRVALIIQGATGYVFSLFANWHVEHHRTRGFLERLDIRSRADAAEMRGQALLGLSLTDPLTGLPNRRHLDHEFERTCEAGGPMTLMMIDVDHFKLYNDRLGHAAGDECLRRVGACLSAYATRTGGFVARFGGEEFTLLYAGRHDPALADGAVRAVQEMTMAHPGRKDGIPLVTISLGLAVSDDDGPPLIGHLVEKADRALYEAKRAGRNQIRAAA